MKSLSGKIAVVTGASRGVGKGIALGLAGYGATIYVTGRTETDDDLPDFLKETTIYETAKAVNMAGGTGIAHHCDFSSDSDVHTLFDRIKREQGRLDILVNNAWAGAYHVMSDYFWNTPFWKQPTALFDDFYTVGLRSGYLCSQRAAEMMIEQNSGMIANISFFSARRYWINPSHGIFKAATDKMTADTAHELKEYGVKVFSIYPGHVRTEGMVELAKHDSSIDLQKTESPQLTGMCVAALATDDNALSESGSVVITAEIARRYHFTDIDGKQPVSLRGELW